MSAGFNRFLFNNKTISGIPGFTNMSRKSFMDMKPFESWVKIWSRNYATRTIGCEIYVCDSVTETVSTYSGTSYTRPTILRCSLWINSESTEDSIYFKLCSSYGVHLRHPLESFEEFKQITVDLSKVLRESI